MTIPEVTEEVFGIELILNLFRITMGRICRSFDFYPTQDNLKRGVISSRMNKNDQFDFSWTIVGLGFITLALSYGTWYSSSVFFVALLKEFGWSRSVGAGVFALFMFLHHLIGPVVGRMVDRFGPRRVMLLGCFFSCLGLFLSSLVQTPWQYYVSFGFLTAIGIAGTGWVTNTTIIHYWFKEKRGLPTGIISSGIGMGILFCVPATQYLINHIGWRMTYRVMAGVMPGVMAFMAILLLRKPPPLVPSKPIQRDVILPEASDPEAYDQTWSPRPWTIRQAMATGQFWCLFFAFFLGNLISQTVLAHQVAFFVDRGMDALSASYIAGLVGATSVVAKIFLGTLPIELEQNNLHTGGPALVSLGPHPRPFQLRLCKSCTPLRSPIRDGLCGDRGLPPVITGDFFWRRTYGRIFGTLMIANGLGGGLGIWGAGYIHDQTKNYVPAFLLVIGCFILSAYLIWRAAPLKIKGAGNKRLKLISPE
jgi:MFS family permease